MKIYTSYFYKVRFFKPYMIPLSTAIWAPKWFHNFKGQDYTFKDKNGVWNGIRAWPLAPDDSCSGYCQGRENCAAEGFTNCEFIRRYRAQLNKIDFSDFMAKVEWTANHIKELENFEEEPVVIFLVHEAPNNPCSERKPIQEWFAAHGIKVTEWERD